MAKNGKAILLLFEPEFVAQIDQARGDVPRTVWIKRACENTLGVAALIAKPNPFLAEPVKHLYGTPAPETVSISRASSPGSITRFDPETGLPIGPIPPKPGSRLKSK